MTQALVTKTKFHPLQSKLQNFICPQKIEGKGKTAWGKCFLKNGHEIEIKQISSLYCKGKYPMARV